ncbi:MAG: hypothetical protein A2Y61_04010 [Chloroflexi bacterium RBG_13_60_13]|nr:MAG: hypothetical protein A2Y61_04010 [Chloroflexi bacterium RBG_13_60_13]
MPFWQREILRDAVSMTFAQTHELDLPKSGLLGSLVLYISSSQNGYPCLGAVPKWRLIDYVSKIEVIGDGAEVIKSWDGKEALAAAFYDDGQEPPGLWRQYSSTPQRQWIPIHFGRKLMDELYGLDLSRFDQVTLKITNDASSTYWTTDIKLTVIAYWLRDAMGPFGGYFRDEVWKSWTPVAAAIEYSDLPVALPIRRILLEARPARTSATCKNDSSMHALMSDIDFTFKTGQVRVYKGSLEALGHLSVIELGRFVEARGSIDRTAGLGFECGVGYVHQNLGYGGADADSISTALSNMSMDIQDSAQEMAYRSGNGQLQWAVRGHGYMHTLPLWNARKPDLADLLDPEGQKVVKVDILTATGTDVSGSDRNARNAIILSRLVR